MREQKNVLELMSEMLQEQDRKAPHCAIANNDETDDDQHHHHNRHHYHHHNNNSPVSPTTDHNFTSESRVILKITSTQPLTRVVLFLSFIFIQNHFSNQNHHNHNNGNGKTLIKKSATHAINTKNITTGNHHLSQPLHNPYHNNTNNGFSNNNSSMTLKNSNLNTNSNFNQNKVSIINLINYKIVS